MANFKRGDKLTTGEIVLEVISSCEAFTILKVEKKRNALYLKNEIYNEFINYPNDYLKSFIGKFIKYKNGYYFISKPDNGIYSVVNGPYANNLDELMSLCIAARKLNLKGSLDKLNDLIYFEEFDLLIPIKFKDVNLLDFNYLMGAWLSDGLKVSAKDVEKVCMLNNWLDEKYILTALKSLNIDVNNIKEKKKTTEAQILTKSNVDVTKLGDFELPGREKLTKYFNEQIIDFVKNMAKYAKMGITSVPATLLYGQPGCGKTYAVEKLAEFLKLPCFEINSSSVASPYIHDTSKKIAEVFDKAIKAAPSVLIIDEMESYVSCRANTGNGIHHIEEVDEFLRNIPRAINAKVIVFGMTNMIDAIDPAILRKGRFDFIEEVGMPNKQEITAVLENSLMKIPIEENINLNKLSEELLNRPLSDVSYVVRQAARIAVRENDEKVSDKHLFKALSELEKNKKAENKRRIGF